MTKVIQNQLFVTISLLIVFSAICFPSGAIPWSGDDVELRKAVDLLQEVKKVNKFTEAQRTVFLELINSKDEVIVCLAACSTRNIKEKDEALLSTLKSILQKDASGFRKTFLTLAILHQELFDKDNTYKIQVYEELTSTDRSSDRRSLSLEAAKEILALDRNKGIALLNEYCDDDHNYTFAAHLVLSNIDKPEDSWVFRSGIDKYDTIINLYNGALGFRENGDLVPTRELKQRAAEKQSNAQKKEKYE